MLLLGVEQWLLEYDYITLGELYKGSKASFDNLILMVLKFQMGVVTSGILVERGVIVLKAETWDKLIYVTFIRR